MPKTMPKLRRLNREEMKRMKKNRREMSRGNLPSERFLGQMSLDKASEKLQDKLSKFKI